MLKLQNQEERLQRKTSYKDSPTFIKLAKTVASGNYYDSIKRQNIILFETNKTEKKISAQEDKNSSFGETISRLEGKELNLRIK